MALCKFARMTFDIVKDGAPSACEHRIDDIINGARRQDDFLPDRSHRQTAKQKIARRR